MSKSIRQQRFETVSEIICLQENQPINSVLEFGCGDGKFIPYLQNNNLINRIAVVDKDETKIKKIKKKHSEIEAYCTSFLCYDNIFYGFDCVIAIEVIEHLTESNLDDLNSVIFNKIKPILVVFTTPNIDYNNNYSTLYNGLRHSSHLFEFSPEDLKIFGQKITNQYNNYIYHTGFCDSLNSSQFIVFKRRNNNE